LTSVTLYPASVIFNAALPALLAGLPAAFFAGPLAPLTSLLAIFAPPLSTAQFKPVRTFAPCAPHHFAVLFLVRSSPIAL
jgi:hypothetical protein